MPDIPPDLITAVREQADARLGMKVADYARYLTPEAVDSLRASFPGIPPRVARYEYSLYETRGGNDLTIDVRYFTRDDSFVVRSRWRKDTDGWMVAHAERLWAEGDKRPGFASRLLASLLGRRRPRRG